MKPKHGWTHDLLATARMLWDAHIKTSRVWKTIRRSE